jgi:hypothetical protein
VFLVNDNVLYHMLGSGLEMVHLVELIPEAELVLTLEPAELGLRLLAAFTFVPSEFEHPEVDRSVLAFLKSETLHPADFTIREDGVVRLNPELARRVARCWRRAR